MSRTLTVHLKGGLLLGVGEAYQLNDATLRRDGAPFIPASALKGAIREQLARLGDDEAVAELFGSSGRGVLDQPGRKERYGGGNSRILFSDAELVDGEVRERFRDGSGYAVRAQVSIDRRSHRSADQRLFHREIVAPFAGDVVFAATVDARGLTEEQERLFQAAVRAVFAIGAGRTAGLGGVEMRLEDSGSRPPSGKALNVPEAPRIDLVLEAVDPVCIGADRFISNFHTSLAFIPASTLRGAVVTAALEHRGVAGVDQRGDPDFDRLVMNRDTCLRFGNAVPAKSQRAPSAAPATLRVCKYGGERHGHRDTLIRDFARLLLAEHGQFVAPADVCRHPECGERLVPAGAWFSAAEPQRRVVTRLGMDHRSGRGADGQLFSLELLERGTCFRARLGGVGAAGRELLRDAARHGLRVGHGRGQGYGRMRIVSAHPVADEPLEDRVKAFDEQVRDAVASVAGQGADAGELADSKALYLAATLASDLVVETTSAETAEQAFLKALGLDGAEPLYGQVRASQRGGFDAMRSGPRSYLPVVRAGSVLLLRLHADLDRELLDRLQTLEDRGIGAAREQGLGWVRFSDPIHRPGWRTLDDEA